MMNIRINKYAVNLNDNSHIVRVCYKQPFNGRYHPFDTRAAESHYISEQGFSFLGDIDSITQKSCIDNIESQLKFNRHIRFIYQRLLIIHNGVVIWDNKKEPHREKNYFKGFVLHALYGEFIAEEHKCGYNITNSGLCADEVYIWDSCDYALGRALNFSRKNPNNYCLLSGISFDYNELIKDAPVPPWAITELKKNIMKNLINDDGENVIYNTEAFFNYFNTLTRNEKKKIINNYPEPPEWRNWYASEGSHRNTDVTKQYKEYLQKIEEKKSKLKAVSSSINIVNNRVLDDTDDETDFEEDDYFDAKEMFFRYNGSLADMCADETMESYIRFEVPKALEKKWTDELTEIWLENISQANDCLKSSAELINAIHRDSNFLLMKKFAVAFENSYFLIDSYEFLTICEMVLEKINYEKYGRKREFIFLLDEFENFIAETVERKNIKCVRNDISENEIRIRFALMLKKIMQWQTACNPL
jgi:hypothetical protein